MIQAATKLPVRDRRIRAVRRLHAERRSTVVGREPGRISPALPPLAHRGRAVAEWAAAAAIAIGVLVLSGWAFDIGVLKQVFPGLPTMKVNTAICFVTAGAALFLLHPARPARWLPVGRALAWVPALIGGLTLVEYLGNVDVRIDQLLFADDDSLSAPGRPSPITAVAFVLTAASLLAVRPQSSAALRLSQYLAAAAATVVLLGLLGYLYDAALIRNARAYTSMALHTVIGLEVLLLGILLARAETGFMRLIVGDDAGAVMARRLVPAVILFGVTLGWVRLQLQRSGLIDTETGIALMVAGLCGFVVVLAMWLASVISGKDRELRANLLAANAAEQRAADLARSLNHARYRLALAVRSGQIGVWDWDVATGVVTWDEQMYALYGVPPGTLVRYATWAGAVHPADLAQAEANLQRAIAGKAATDNLFRIRLPSGELRHIAASQDVVVDATGDVARVIGVNRDVTALREAEARLRDSEEKLRLTFRHSAVGSAIVSLDGRFDEANDALCGMVGYSARELSGLTFQAITHPDARDKDLDLVHQLLTGGIPSYQLEKRCVHKDGHSVWVRISVALARDEQAAPHHFVVQVEDITLRREAQQSAARVLRELESFSYSVAHDLGAPLRAISGFSALLGRRPAVAADDRATELLAEVRQAAARMGQLIDDLLTLSKVERGTFKRERVDVSSMARDILGRLARSSEGRAVECIVPDGLVADADARLLRIALDNLLGNAWKYTSQCKDARIEVGASVDGGRTTYFVRDNGAGFDMAHVEKLFQPFQRLHAATEFEGTGIGLATVRRIIDRHGGMLAGTGKVGAGATFTFTLG